MDTLHPEEAIGYGTARITGSSDQYIHLLLALFPDEVAQQTSHKTSAHILEGKGRTVEQLQRIDILRYFH